MLKFSSILLVVTVLVGCKVDSSTDVFVSDIFADSNLRTPAVMKVEVPSCTSDRLPQIQTSALALFSSESEAKIAGCNRAGLTSYIELTFKAEIASESSTGDLILFRVVADNDQHQLRGVRPLFSPEFLTRVQGMMRENHQRLDFDDTTFSLVLSNDDVGQVYVSAGSVWVDDTPYEYLEDSELSRREKMTITLSNVASDLVLRGQAPTAIWVLKPKS